MRKIFLFVLIANLAATSINAQIAYYDALKLAVYEKKGNSLNDEDIKKVAGILALYMPDSLINNTDAARTIANFKIGNRFFIPYFKNVINKGGGRVGFGLSSASVISSIGGLDITNVASGIAQFMIKRSKEELTIAFFDKFKKFAKDYPEFQVLFPKTTSNLVNLLSFQYPEMLSALRSGFYDDVRSITYHLDDVIELPKYQALLKNLPQLRVVVRSITLMHDIESGNSSPAEILRKFSEFKEWDEKGVSNDFMNFGSSVKLAAIFSQSLKNDPSVSNDSTRSWISVNEIENLVDSAVGFNLYLSLIYQQSKKSDIRFHINKTDILFSDIMNDQSNNLILFQNQLKEFIDLAHKVDTLIADVKFKKQNHISLADVDYYNYISASIDVIEYAFSIGKLFDENMLSGDYTKILTTINDVYKNIFTREYSQAMVNAINVLDDISALVYNANKDNLLNEAGSLLKGLSDTIVAEKISFENLKEKDISKIENLISLHKKDTAVVRILSQVIAFYSFKKFDDILSRIAKYGMFMANVINAKTPQEIESVMESTVLPVGSSSIKKNSDFNISVQGYLGAFFQMQKTNNAEGTWNDKFGVSGPIGISLSYGFKKYGSLSLFASLFDIGAVVDYKLKQDSIPVTDTSTTPVIKKDYSVKLGQIISPGCYIVYGLLGNIPLSIGVGGQYGPGLGKIQSNGNTIINNPRWRWNAFLSVDIPFFTLKNSAKKYKVNN